MTEDERGGGMDFEVRLFTGYGFSREELSRHDVPTEDVGWRFALAATKGNPALEAEVWQKGPVWHNPEGKRTLLVDGFGLLLLVCANGGPAARWNYARVA